MIQETFQVQGTPDIEVRIESGRIEVRRGQDGQVRVQVDTRDPNFIVEQRGNSILVSSDKTQSWLSRGSAFVIIETPEPTDLRAAVASAQISVDVPLDKVDIKTASGEIELDHGQVITIKTASGDARIRYVGRALKFTSASGDLDVSEKVHGSVAVSTASGDVDIHECDASMNVNTVSGDVRVSRFTGRTANFKGMSGTIEIGVPSRTRVDLDVNLLSGRLDLPEPEPNKGEPERDMSIRAKLVSGDLIINRA